MLYTICSKYHPGVDTHLRNVELLGLSRHLYIEELSEIPSDATSVIFGAWHISYEPVMKFAKRKGIKIGYLWTSSPTETELHSIILHQRQHELLYQASNPTEMNHKGEISLLNRILAMKKNNEIDFIWFAKRDFIAAFEDDGIFHAPHPVQERPRRNSIPDRNNISLFLSPAIKKNIYSQYLAFIAARRRIPDLHLRTSLPLQTTSGVTALGWMPQETYEREINNTYLALHVSLAESFAYGAYEFLARGIPCLVSPTIARNLSLPSQVDIVIQNIDSVKEIADRIQYIVELDEEYYKGLSETLYKYMGELKEHNNASLVKIFREQGIV
ncbi:MAG: hypothetical protein OIN66_10400 [Candidatus Methanoperedens sp.]|nr:hypothetical protein [Candidatus Methanoperedens sp.]